MPFLRGSIASSARPRMVRADPSAVQAWPLFGLSSSAFLSSGMALSGCPTSAIAQAAMPTTLESKLSRSSARSASATASRDDLLGTVQQTRPGVRAQASVPDEHGQEPAPVVAQSPHAADLRLRQMPSDASRATTTDRLPGSATAPALNSPSTPLRSVKIACDRRGSSRRSIS